MKKALIPVIVVIVLVAVFVVTKQQKKNKQTAEESAKAAKTVNLVYVEWSSEVASTHVIKSVIEDKLGYNCKITPVSAAAMWKAVSTGDQDGMVAAWLPTTHGHYLENAKDKVQDLGANLVGTKIGLVVPKYVEIDSIADLNLYPEKFNSEIIGIDPGAGIMSKTENAVKEYNLKEYKLVEGSGATMTGALDNAIRQKKPIVVTGWTPHWKFARWDLKYLQDPKNVYGDEEEIHTIVRNGLKQDMPDVYYVLDNFHWTPKQMQTVMSWNQEDGADPYETAKKWVSENSEIVAEWLPKKKQVN
jgi:glycine betaine/proline transport system substrate-binding protein